MNQATTPLPVVDSSSQKVTFRNGIRITSNPKDMKSSPSLSFPTVDTAQQQQVLQQMVPVNISSSSTATGNTPTTSPVPMVQNVPVQNAASTNVNYLMSDIPLPTRAVTNPLPAPPEVITPQGPTPQTIMIPRSVVLGNLLRQRMQGKSS